MSVRASRRYDFACAWTRLVWTRFCLRVAPLRRRVIDDSISAVSFAGGRTPDPDLVSTFAAAVAAQPTPPGCVARSLALSAFLRRRGIRTRLCLGVRKDGAAISGHAWVESDGGLVADREEFIRSFVPLAWGDTIETGRMPRAQEA
jgi:hypothetical protein